MAQFYLLPPRPIVGEALSWFLRDWFPGLPRITDDGVALADAVQLVASQRPMCSWFSARICPRRKSRSRLCATASAQNPATRFLNSVSPGPIKSDRVPGVSARCRPREGFVQSPHGDTNPYDAKIRHERTQQRRTGTPGKLEIPAAGLGVVARGSGGEHAAAGQPFQIRGTRGAAARPRSNAKPSRRPRKARRFIYSARELFLRSRRSNPRPKSRTGRRLRWAKRRKRFPMSRRRADDKKRRRRRRRRGRRGGAEGDAESAEAPGADESGPLFDTGAEMPAAAANAEDLEEEEDAIEEDEDDIEVEPISFADWTVPTWNELIGSLYRPER